MGLRQEPHHGIGICHRAGKEMLTRSKAKSMAKRVGRETGRNIHAYECRYCDRWHIGNIRKLLFGR